MKPSFVSAFTASLCVVLPFVFPWITTGWGGFILLLVFALSYLNAMILLFKDHAQVGLIDIATIFLLATETLVIFLLIAIANADWNVRFG